MTARGWLRTMAGVGLSAALSGPAAAQNYDGDMLFRFGLFGQGTFTSFGVTLPAVGTASSDGLIGGMSIGIDYRPHRAWLIGVEVDGSIGDSRGVFNGVSYGTDYLTTVRGRFGILPHENFLIYGTAGGALLSFEAQSTTTGVKAAETIGGMIVGVGAEASFGPVILFGEYDYVTFGSRQFTLNGVRHETDADSHLVRLGLKFKVGHDHYARQHDSVK